MTDQSRWITRLVLVALIALGISPLLPPSRFLFLDDGFLHLFRIDELDRMIRQGIVYPRWASDFASGYGYPIFNFYPPLAYYLAETFHIIGFDLPVALQLTLALIVAIAALGAFVLGRDLFDSDFAGLLVAAAYIFFPYFLLDVYIRGALAEALAAALLPWFAWAIRRVILQRDVSAMVALAFFSAAILLAHNLTALLSAPFLIAFLAWQLARVSEKRRALARAIGAGIIGAGLAAFYWLPMLIELPLVAISRANKALTDLLVGSFLAPAHALQASVPFQYVDQPYPFAPITLAIALLAIFFAWRAHRGLLAIFGATALIGIALSLDFARDFWLNAPLLKTIQFAWRIQVLIGLGIAIITGALASRRAMALIVIAILAWNGLANLAARKLDNPRGDLTIGQIARFEANTRGLGFGSFAEYLPLTVQTLAPKLDVTSAFPAPSIAVESFDPQRIALRVSSSHSETILLRAFYFPGWQATLDGAPLDLFPSTPLGLITLDLPPGTHRVVIWFGDTLARQIGAIISGLAALILVGAIIRFARTRIALILIASVLVLVLPSTFVALTAPRRAIQSTQIEVSPALRLIGLRIENATLASTAWRAQSDSLDLQVVWFARQQIADAPFTWRLVDDAGRMWATRAQSSRYATGFPEVWVPNEIVEDHFDLPLASEMPAGKYQLQVGYGASPRFVQVAFVELIQSAPRQSIAMNPRARIGDAIELMDAIFPARVNAGNSLSIKMDWRATRDLFEDFTVLAQLVDLDGNVIAQRDGMTQDMFFPTMLWSPGRIVSDQRALALARDASPGIYRLLIGLYRAQNLERLPVVTADGESPDAVVDLGEVIVPINAPNANPRTALRAQLGDAIQFLGYDLQSRELILHWHARARPEKNYHVFVHIVDARGQLVAQTDGAPRGNRYPTRIWDAGERVPDAHALNVAPGKYTIRVGMYDPISGERLPAFDAQGNELPNRAITFEIEVSAR
ncbi:MAG: hypothetical protein HZC40_09120 [Chloroflexi bacterium]|nr:hypothetical protein [Chloroflexota bacterium]